MIAKLPAIQTPCFHKDMITIDPMTFEQCVDRKPFRLQHELNKHPLFQLENLVELSKRLPKNQREYVFGKKEFGSHDDVESYRHAAENDELSTDQMIENIEKQNIVIVLRNVETDTVYGQFVNECLDCLSGFVEPISGRISTRESFIFVSPPRAYTPYHYDPEQNFFMQIRGGKEMAVYDVLDRDVLPESALEKYYTEGQAITKCDDELFDRHDLFQLSPGEGVYVPVTAPHWVRTLDEISISVSVNFRTPSSIRRARAYRLNRTLRKFGLRPSPVSPQASTFGDRTKSAILNLPAMLKKMMGRK